MNRDNRVPSRVNLARRLGWIWCCWASVCNARRFKRLCSRSQRRSEGSAPSIQRNIALGTNPVPAQSRSGDPGCLHRNPAPTPGLADQGAASWIVHGNGAATVVAKGDPRAAHPNLPPLTWTFDNHAAGLPRPIAQAAAKRNRIGSKAWFTEPSQRQARSDYEANQGVPKHVVVAGSWPVGEGPAFKLAKACGSGPSNCQDLTNHRLSSGAPLPRTYSDFTPAIGS